MIIKNHTIVLEDTSPAEMARFRQIMIGIWRQQIEDDKNAAEMEKYIKDKYATTKKLDAKYANGLNDSDERFLGNNITINSKGYVTKLIKKEGANKFFDENGTELFFNDPKITDKHMLYGYFEIKNKIFTPIVNVLDRIKAAGEISPNVSGSYKNTSDYIKLAIKSNGDWDFPTGLKMEYKISNEEMNKAGYNGGSRTYFKFGKHNVIYNIADAGQFLWGNAVSNSGFLLESALDGVDFYEKVMSKGQNGDSAEDTQAIKNGYNYQYYNQKVRGWDQE
ncbi:hypothetical protein IUY40_19070 [Flavobacterium sp. ALJ2]|uniref:hypothetical protein n=1 Tax=Flavobacterium sp. ALJ2 TaxID=2786960 RepID=UPI0018A0A1F5|nr:hypothetical protein [Flavobacterium sp. ALJ2]MBF7093628.1 hypothetical protein [Flavobacterium sp. ALJ2]